MQNVLNIVLEIFREEKLRKRLLTDAQAEIRDLSVVVSRTNGHEKLGEKIQQELVAGGMLI